MIGKFISEYYFQVNAAKNENDLLIAIALFAKKLDYLYPFIDGNIRTIRLLVQKLLLENKLCPTMMWDPNIIDGYSSDEVVLAIKKGQEYFENLKNGQQAFVPARFSEIKEEILLRFLFRNNATGVSAAKLFSIV